MNKKSIIVIAVLILLPVLFSVFLVRKWQKNNTVVANYGDTIDIIEYNGVTYHAVPDPDSYMAQIGKYIGKVSDPLLGAAFYTVKNDTSGDLYALASEKGTVLYTKSGKLPASAFGGSRITRAWFDSFSKECSSEKALSVIDGILSLSSSAVYCPDDKEEVRQFELRPCYDGCPVSATSAGWVLYFTKSGTWYFLSADEKAAVDESYANGDIEKKEYGICLISSGGSIRYLKSLLISDVAEESEGTTEKVS